MAMIDPETTLLKNEQGRTALMRAVLEADNASVKTLLKTVHTVYLTDDFKNDVLNAKILAEQVRSIYKRRELPEPLRTIFDKDLTSPQSCLFLLEKTIKKYAIEPVATL